MTSVIYVGYVSSYTNYYVVIKRNSGAQPRFLHVVAWNGLLTYATNGNTMAHKAVENAFCVGAVSAHGRTTPFNRTEPIESYSS